MNNLIKTDFYRILKAKITYVSFIIAAVVLLIIAFFKNISGVKSAAKDDGAFQKALIMLMRIIRTFLIKGSCRCSTWL